MSPEDIIQAAWVERANQDIQDRQAGRLTARRTPWPVWAPEVAVRALREAGLLKGCGCQPEAVAEAGPELERMVCGVPRPLTEREFQVIDAFEEELREMSGIDQALRDIADGGEWPEVGA